MKTVNDILMILRIAFDFAEEEYNITMPKISFLRETKKEARVLSNIEQQILIQFLVTDMDIYKFGVLFALYTGVRVGELCALQWEDITDDYVQINKTMQRLRIENGKTQIIIGEPKSNSEVMTRNNFGKMTEYVNKKILKTDSEIMKGNIEILPYAENDSKACDYCEMKEVCLFDKNKDNVRKLCVKAEEAWEIIDRELKK